MLRVMRSGQSSAAQRQLSPIRADSATLTSHVVTLSNTIHVAGVLLTKKRYCAPATAPAPRSASLRTPSPPAKGYTNVTVPLRTSGVTQTCYTNVTAPGLGVHTLYKKYKECRDKHQCTFWLTQGVCHLLGKESRCTLCSDIIRAPRRSSLCR
eukprot:1180544-Prorocentrum_minimum.AAC.1